MTEVIKELMAINEQLDKIEASISVEADGPGAPPAPKKPEKKESPYDVRKEETMDTTRSFAENAYDTILDALDSVSIFKARLDMISKKEAFRINPENVKYLDAVASKIESTLEAAYNEAENLMLAIEAGKLS